MNAACCRDMDITLEHLLHPERMGPDGQEFVEAHGLKWTTLHELQEGIDDLGNGLVKIQHKCQHLTDDGKCDIYATRPKICREFDCARRDDCDCGGNCVRPISAHTGT